MEGENALSLMGAPPRAPPLRTAPLLGILRYIEHNPM